MNPLDGRTGLADVRDATGHGHDVRLQLDSGQTVFLKTSYGALDGPGWTYDAPTGDPMPIAGQWSVEFVTGGPELPLANSIDALEFVGLMGIPPLGWNPEEAFARLASERDRVQRAYTYPLGLSAGMSADLEVAVRHGSTCVRVGTALMGQRPLTSP